MKRVFKFNKELNSNIEDVLQELSVFLNGKNINMYLIKNDEYNWYFDLDDSLDYIPTQIMRLGEETSLSFDFQEKYWIYRPLIKKERNIYIGGVQIDWFDKIAWESLGDQNEDFIISIEVLYNTIRPISNDNKLISVEIISNQKRVASLISNWFGGYVSHKKNSTYFYDSEIKYLLRPPISRSFFYSKGIVNQDSPIESLFKENPNILMKHSLICGQSGSGKTNSARIILDSLLENSNLDSLLLLDIKGEYASWAKKNEIDYLPIGNKPQFLKTLKINPFIPPSHITLSTHIDHLSQLFSVASFGGAGLVLPSYMKLFLFEFFKFYFNVSEQRFYEYLYYTGNVLRNKNIRFYKNGESILESMLLFWNNQQNEILKKIFFGNSSRQIADVASVLSGRFQSLRYGLLNFFNYSDSGQDFTNLFSQKVVLSFSGASKDQINFISSLFALLYTTSINSTYESNKLKHLLVIEEAHRIMGKVNSIQDGINSQASLSDLMQEAISELRSKGVGIIIIDQSPSRLISGVIANSGTKIVHRLDLASDQEIMISALAWEDQSSLSRFDVGECLIRSDRPVVQQIKMPEWKL